MRKSSLYNTLKFSALAVLIMLGCNRFREPYVKVISDISIESINQNSADLTINLTFSNPNHSFITYKSSDFNINVNGQQYVAIVDMESFDINPHSEFIIPVKATVNLESLKEGVAHKALNTPKTIQLTCKGMVDFSTKKMDLVVPVEFNEKVNLTPKSNTFPNANL